MNREKKIELLEKLEMAYASGIKRIVSADLDLQYQDGDHLLKAIRDLRRELNQPKKVKIWQAKYESGL